LLNLVKAQSDGSIINTGLGRIVCLTRRLIFVLADLSLEYFS